MQGSYVDIYRGTDARQLLALSSAPSVPASIIEPYLSVLITTLASPQDRVLVGVASICVASGLSGR